MIRKANTLKAGDIFIYNYGELVAVENYKNNDLHNDVHSLWITTRACYNLNEIYSYTSATIITIYPDEEVDVIGHITLYEPENEDEKTFESSLDAAIEDVYND